MGGHKFYLGKFGIGILYFFTFGFFFIGWFIDLFTLGTQVDSYNALYGRQFGNTNTNSNVNNVVVNVPSHGQADNLSNQLDKLLELKNKGALTEEEYNKQKAKLLG